MYVPVWLLILIVIFASIGLWFVVEIIIATRKKMKTVKQAKNLTKE